MNDSKNIYPFKVKKLDGGDKNLVDYRGQVLLIVNTATNCGFTPQFKDLQELRDNFEEGFDILAFPSNDFGGQEPLNGKEIEDFCAENYAIKFPVFGKIMVRGEQAHPLFKFLRDKKLNGNLDALPRWNFHKYLINKKGEVVDYFYPFTKPNSSKVKKKIQRLLNTII